MQDEISAGLDELRAILRSSSALTLKRAQRFGNRPAYHIVVEDLDTEADIQVSAQFLKDLPNTDEHQEATRTYFRELAQRMMCGHPHEFYCRRGVPIRIEIYWPLEHVQGRAASFVHVYVYDLRVKSSVAKCSLIITSDQDMFDLKRNPFTRERAIVQTIRRAVDAERLTFLREDEHPSLLQQLHLETRHEEDSPAPLQEIQSFLSGKIYWLGFKRGSKRTRVWIADPLDAKYVGVSTQALAQSAQILAAHKLIVLDETQEFAFTRDALLRKATTFEIAYPTSVESSSGKAANRRSTQQWDVFICHASEDKNVFVQPLADALKAKRLRVWYDDFTLKVGDSLRRSIDRGLSHSRYGVVVLSPAFFGKDWPERELDGLVAKEVGGRKVILPVWLNVTAEDVRNYSLTLADRVAASSSDGLDAVVEKLVEAISG